MKALMMAFLPAMTICAAAQTPVSQVSGSNLPADFYPRSPCVKPQKLGKDGTARTNAEQFNQLALAFNACIKLYVDNARSDTQQILAAATGQSANTTSIPAGGGNMPAGFYPSSPCIQPVPPDSGAAPDPQSVRGRGFVRPLQNDPRAEDYNRRVHAFNAEAAAFNVCTKRYTDNAKRDIEQVQTIVRAAVADANAN